MKRILQFDQQYPLLIEIDTPEQTKGEINAGVAGTVIERTKRTILDSMKPINIFIREIMETVKMASEEVSEIEVSFGIKFDAKADVIVASSTVESNISVTVKWSSKP